MKKRGCRFALALGTVLLAFWGTPPGVSAANPTSESRELNLRSRQLRLVQSGQPMARIYRGTDGAEAANDLAKYLEKISGARLEIRVLPGGASPPPGEAAIVVGSLARRLGLPPPPRTPSGDGYRLVTRGRRILLAGESEESTFFAACHLLETLGCRWFFDNALGEVVPKTPTITVGSLDVAEKPDFVSRSIWGPNWHRTDWKRRNRIGGLRLPTGHDWQWLPPSRYGQEHPEYYALRGGARRPGAWLCTSNLEVRRLFAEALAHSVRGRGSIGVSISPPDGTGYCQCENCQAEDVAGYIEPSSGHVAVSDRYLRFFDAVARKVRTANPEAILNFYAYADYSLPAKKVRDTSSNLCAWIAPIRFCRLHSLQSTICPSRARCREVVEGWSRVVSNIGWREYNYNLAELTAPFSKISIWRDDFPYLKKKGCLGVNIESLALWHIYGLNTYLAARLAWDADADVDALLDDFYARFCEQAAPHVKAYWGRIDKAYREAKVHAGSFYSLHAVWTPTLLDACQSDLAAAKNTAESELTRKRIEMFRSGLQNVEYYLAVREATNRCDFTRAKKLYEKWIAHMDAVHEAGIHSVGEYRRGYAPRFLGGAIEEGFARTSGKFRLVKQLPDEWLLRYDPEDAGESRGWHKVDTNPEGWRRVLTYSATLNEQGVPEELTWMWYRTAFTAPQELPPGPVHLWFAEIDGREGRVFLNGEPVGSFRGSRQPHEVEITGKLLAGRENVVAVKIDHRRISELMLGGIIKPVLIYGKVKRRS